MPPRNAPTRGSPPTRSTPQGTTRGGGRRARTVHADIEVGLPSNASHVKAVGVKRQEFGKSGRKISIVVNAYNMTLPESTIYHYDVIITPKGNSDRTGPKLNFELVKELQTTVRRDIFTPEGSYDGRKNMFFSHQLDLGDSDSKEFDIPVARGAGGPPRTFKIRLTLANKIMPETLHQFVDGKLSFNEDVSTAMNALHVAVRMDAIMRMPYHGRSFFTDDGKKPLNNRGLELWRGYFQSIRPCIGKMIINVDIATGAMYKPGPLIALCLDFVNHREPLALAPSRGFTDDRRRKLQQFLKGIRVVTDYSGERREYPVLKLSSVGARDLKFKKHDDSEISVANYFRVDLHRPLQHPEVICVQVTRSGAWLPLEVCTVPAGQVYKNDFPDDKDFRTDVVRFSTMKPADRFASIQQGLTVLAHGQSQYIRDLGFSIDTSAPITVDSARIIGGPKLKYGANSKQKDFAMVNGAWNMVDKKFFKPGVIKKWVIVIFVDQSRFNMPSAQNVVKEFVETCGRVGITVEDKDPIIRWETGEANIGNKLLRAGIECKNQKGTPPDFMMAILPDSALPIYKEVKYFGDVKMGIATQCMKASLCNRAKEQYWMNILLKVNPKLGGVNAIPDPSSLGALADATTPTMIIGADAMHPPPHTTDRPSYTSLVGSVDINTSHYVACSRVQASGKRRDIIVDLKEMCKYVMEKHISYRKHVEKVADGRPKRIIFYRDGVSQGEFQQVIDDELPLIRAACEELNIQAKITLIVSVKRHHIRFKPQLARDGDRIGNCLAGTIVDKGIASPLEYDFFLLSHAAIQGTSRPTYYAILHDDYGFKPDAIQAITYTLCHVYARSTRSVSIPAPVYYADIVCARAKNHYEPSFNISDTGTNTTDAQRILEKFKEEFKPLHGNHAGKMYFM